MKRSENEYAVPINIYPSLWKSLLFVIGCMAFAVTGYWIQDNPSADPVKKVLFGWLAILFFSEGVACFSFSLRCIVKFSVFLC